jgi:hypothetical protein
MFIIVLTPEYSVNAELEPYTVHDFWMLDCWLVHTGIWRLDSYVSRSIYQSIEITVKNLRAK